MTSEQGIARIAAWACRAVCTAGALAGMCLATVAQDGGPDTARLNQLIIAGDYRAAIAEARTLAESTRPKAKDGSYGPRVMAAVDILTRQGTLERAIGALDAAETTLGEAFQASTEREFQRRLMLAVRAGGEQATAALVPFELVFVDLLDQGMGLLIDRLRQDGASAEPEKIAGWLAQFDQLAKQAAAARQGLAERLDLAGPALARSPRARLLASDIEPLRLQGMLALAKSRLPAGDKDGGGAAAGRAAAKKARDEAVAKLAQAVEQAEEILAPPADAEPAEAELERQQRAEADRLQADLLECLAEAQLLAGKAEAAEESIDRALAIRQAMLDEGHPDLLRATILAAGIAEAQRRASEAAGRSFPAREQAKRVATRAAEAQALLERHERVFSASWPWRAALAAVAKNVPAADTRAPQDPAVADAVDAATQRVMPLIHSLP